MQNPKIPREKIPWFPAVNYEACIGDRDCLEFCKNGVFDWDDALGRPIVARRNNCVLGCDACSQICPAEAIRFPSKAELRAMMRQYATSEASDVATLDTERR